MRFVFLVLFNTHIHKRNRNRRGFRVRVGIHSGLDEGADVFWTKRSGRRAYSGSAMRQARLLSDAALGGMVVLSTACLELLRPLPNERLPLGAMVWHSGRCGGRCCEEGVGVRGPCRAGDAS